MRKDIHPDYDSEFALVCSTCKTTHKFGSTAKNALVDVCSNCHPFYTGDRSFSRVTGRVQRFKNILEKQKSLKSSQDKSLS